MYPNSTDYVEVLQDPHRAFRRPDLQRARFALDPILQIPLAASGNAAVVFRAEVAGRDQALRFFIKEDVSEKQRYTALDHHFVTHRMESWVSRASWVDDAVAVHGGRWPMVQMDWIEGTTVQGAAFAHGDLQHGNVLVEPRGGLRFVDFDGSWIADFDGFTPPRERGHPNYQHVRRTWGRWMDTFPALVIYTGLLALVHKPKAWRNNEGMLFTRDDLLRPGATATWQLLADIADPETAQAVTRLQAACTLERQPEEDLEHLLEREQLTAHGTAAELFRLSGRVNQKWYEDALPPVEAEKTFTGVRRSGPSPVPDPPSTTPSTTPSSTRSTTRSTTPTASAAVAVLAGSIAFVVALVIGVVVGQKGGPGGLVGVITAVVVFSAAMPLLRRTL